RAPGARHVAQPARARVYPCGPGFGRRDAQDRGAGDHAVYAGVGAGEFYQHRPGRHLRRIGPGHYRAVQPQRRHAGHDDLLGHAAPGAAARTVGVDTLPHPLDHAALYRAVPGLHRLVRLLCDEKRPSMIRIQNYSAYYTTVQGTVKAVEDVSFNIYDGEIVGIAGESGCG